MARLIIMDKGGELDVEDLTLEGREFIKGCAKQLIEAIDNYEDEEEDDEGEVEDREEIDGD